MHRLVAWICCLKGSIQVKNTTAIFNPGIYYMDAGAGFSNAANGNIIMCSAHCTADTSGCCSGSGSPANGMLVYVKAGQVSLTANSNAAMVGSSGSCTLANTNCYLGMLFLSPETPPKTRQVSAAAAT